MHRSLIRSNKEFFIDHSLSFDHKGWSSPPNQEGIDALPTWFRKQTSPEFSTLGRATLTHLLPLTQHQEAARGEAGPCVHFKGSILTWRGNGERVQQPPRGQLTSSHPSLGTLKPSTNHFTHHSGVPSCLCPPTDALAGEGTCVLEGQKP